MRIGCVPYGHARPFAAGWAGREIFCDHPRNLVDQLRAGRLDLALVPVWEVLTRPGYRLLSDFAIGSRGEVRSVAVFHDRPLVACSGIRLTPHSLTSVQLWKILAAGPLGASSLREDPAGEAQLLIGDEALGEWSRKQGTGLTDLGQAWTAWTGLPFVYAVWALRPGFLPDPSELDRLRLAWRQGVESRAGFARDASDRDYLTRCIRYGLGEEELTGLREFALRSSLPAPRLDFV